MLKKRIRKTNKGDYEVVWGEVLEDFVECNDKPGYYMPAFIVYQSSRYGTLEEAEQAERW